MEFSVDAGMETPLFSTNLWYQQVIHYKHCDKSCGLVSFVSSLAFASSK